MLGRNGSASYIAPDLLHEATLAAICDDVLGEIDRPNVMSFIDLINAKGLPHSAYAEHMAEVQA
jgi:hypothetical protein